jgi:4,4'-diaponeurosporenoate glycosyltransferase
MYPEGAASLWQGWTKNLAAGAGRVPILRAALVALWVAGGLRASRVAVKQPGGYLLYALQAGVLFRRAGAFHPTLALAYPVPLVAFVVLMAGSVRARAAGRPLSWRGRSVMP